MIGNVLHVTHLSLYYQNLVLSVSVPFVLKYCYNLPTPISVKAYHYLTNPVKTHQYILATPLIWYNNHPLYSLRLTGLKGSQESIAGDHVITAINMSLHIQRFFGDHCWEWGSVIASSNIMHTDNDSQTKRFLEKVRGVCKPL